MASELRARTNVALNGEYLSPVQDSTTKNADRLKDIDDDKEKKARTDPTVSSSALLEKETTLQFGDWTWLGIIVIVATFIRLYKPLSWPNNIV